MDWPYLTPSVSEEESINTQQEEVQMVKNDMEQLLKQLLSNTGTAENVQCAQG